MAVSLGLAKERLSESEDGTRDMAMETEALNHYLHVVYQKNLKRGEVTDAFWLREAGIRAMAILERQDNWVQAKAFTDYLSKLLPSQEDEWLQMMQQWQGSLPQLPPSQTTSTHEISTEFVVGKSQWLHGILLGLCFMPLVPPSELHVERLARKGHRSLQAPFYIRIDNGDFTGLLWRRRRIRLEYGGLWNQTPERRDDVVRACCHCQQPVSIHGQSRALAGAGRGGLAFLRGSFWRYLVVIPYHGQDFPRSM